MVKIGSTVYTIPISIPDLTELGYNTKSDKFNHVLNPKETMDFELFYTNIIDKGGNILSLDVFNNPSNSPRKLSNCMACTFSFNSEAKNISIAKGIKIGSTYDEVCKAFGKKEKKEDKDKGSIEQITLTVPNGEKFTSHFRLIHQTIKSGEYI